MIQVNKKRGLSVLIVYIFPLPGLVLQCHMTHMRRHSTVIQHFVGAWRYPLILQWTEKQRWH